MNAPFKIIPACEAPEKPEKRNGRQLYDFAGMEVGSYFECPDDMGTSKWGGSARQASVSASARVWARRHCPEARFSVHIIVKKNGYRAVGCWRDA